MTDQTIASNSAISEEQVAEYLKQTPEFFVKHETLLEELKLPHDSGKAISLGERQVQLFRESRDELRGQLNELIEVARENDQLFEKTKRLMLNLVEVNSVDEIAYVLKSAFADDANVDFTQMMVFGNPDDYPASDMLVVSKDDARQNLGALIDSQNAICGRFTDKQLNFMFLEHATNVGSAAIIPVRNGELYGMLGLSSSDAAYFDSSMGSLFLSYIADFIARILPRLLMRTRSKTAPEQVPSLLD